MSRQRFPSRNTQGIFIPARKFLLERTRTPLQVGPPGDFSHHQMGVLDETALHHQLGLVEALKFFRTDAAAPLFEDR